MVEIIQTRTFSKWLAKLRVQKAKTVMIERIVRLQYGDAEDSVSEMRIHCGPG